MGPVSPDTSDPYKLLRGPNSDPLHAAQDGNQVQSRWLALAHGGLRLAQAQLKLLIHFSRYTLG
jgi:hypothetical protein